MVGRCTAAVSSGPRWRSWSSQLHLLRRLQLDGPLPVRELAGLLGAEVSTVTGLADQLADRDLVQRQPDPRDRRVRRLVLTPDGDRLATVAWA